MSCYFENRLFKALRQDLKTTQEVVEYCKKECSKNYNDAKVQDMQCICEFLCYRIEHNVKITFSQYQDIQIKELWEKNNK